MKMMKISGRILSAIFAAVFADRSNAGFPQLEFISCRTANHTNFICAKIGKGEQR